MCIFIFFNGGEFMYKHIFCIIFILFLFTMCGSKGSSDDKPQDGQNAESGVWDVTSWDESQFGGKDKSEVKDKP